MASARTLALSRVEKPFVVVCRLPRVRATGRAHPQRTVQESFVCYDFTKAVPTDLLEWKVLVRAICESESFRLSRAQLDDIVRLLSERKVDKWVEFGGKRIKVDRGCLIFPS